MVAQYLVSKADLQLDGHLIVVTGAFGRLDDELEIFRARSVKIELGLG